MGRNRPVNRIADKVANELAATEAQDNTEEAKTGQKTSRRPIGEKIDF